MPTMQDYGVNICGRRSSSGSQNWGERLLFEWIQSLFRPMLILNVCYLIYFISSFDALPRWRSLKHFSQVIAIDFNDASTHEDISKVWTFNENSLI